jgi:predicted site-specific integrase-resolvase
MKPFLNAAEIAKIHGVDRSTVVKWIKKGKFKNVTRLGGTGYYQIPLASYEAWLKLSKVA